MAGGRPSKLTPSTQEAYCEAISIGATYEMAAHYAGISYGSAARWMKLGGQIHQHLTSLEDAIDHAETAPDRKKAEQAYADYWKGLDKKDKGFLSFFEAVEETKATLALEMLKIIYASAMGDATWAAQVLRWKYPNDFGAGKQQVELSSPPDAPMQIEHSGTVKVETEPDVDRIAEILGVLADSGALDESLTRTLKAAAQGNDAETE